MNRMEGRFQTHLLSAGSKLGEGDIMFGKSKKFHLVDQYLQNGTDVKIEEDENAKKRISMRTSTPNRVIIMEEKSDSIRYEIHDANKGAQAFDVPIDIYQMLMKKRDR